ncbi:MAG: adenylate/guanylate cyclase domain-containing protein [Verrucomicrobiota bacterium]
MTSCPSCHAENRPGAKFCRGCGATLAAACPSCGAGTEPGQAFCDECGASLGVDLLPAAEPAAGAERRLVSVLFADLVGFTALSETRDAEEVRELLTRYFDTCRRLIALYGGTVEKFIGDAVMAVWGTPVATEDDAERAVRAALDLVAAVSALGQEVGAEDLRARAGVLTGEAAVTLGAEGQGMVAGDLVNTASRVQSVGEPGTVYVGEATRRATEQTIVYEEAGAFELKGKEGLTPLWRAQRVVSGLRGSLKSQGLEAPFVGRDRELRQIKELFHASADERKAHLVSVAGIAGIGKSRLAWEFYKYFDGIAESVYWHRGRCLSYGEGVTYWALADMVRMRCRIAEDEAPESAQAKLAVTLAEHLLDLEERSFVEPRLGHLLGLTEHRAHDQQDLFAAWRLFFERLAETYPTVLAFEDMQWADASLLDFVEYILDWSRNSPIFVVTLARPELLERRPTWGAGQRNFTSIYLEPLSSHAMQELLAGLVPGLPTDARDQILARAEGVPLYAIETVRMLLDRGLLAQNGPAYEPTGPIEALDVPETLHALIAARLDGLSPEERRLLQDAAVLGKTFSTDALAALSGSDAGIEPLLGALVRKEVLGVQADPRSPEHGQYGFLQDLVRHVAYETLSRRERRAKHLAAAAHLESAFPDEDEIAEVLASHYVDALAALPDADDADTVRARAAETLVRAGERADALGAAGEAHRYLAQAAELVDGPGRRADLQARAGWHAYYAGDYDAARRLLGEAISGLESAGDPLGAARLSGRLAQVEFDAGSVDEALARTERALEVASTARADADVAELASRLGIGCVFTGDVDRGAELLALALDLGESLGDLEVVARVFTGKSIVATAQGHPEEALAFGKHALTIALDHEDWERAYSQYFNLSDLSFQRDRYEDALGYLRSSLEIARRRGARAGEWGTLAEMTYPLYMLGRWDEALATAAEIPEERIKDALTLSLLASTLEISVHRGDYEEARRTLSLFDHVADSSDVQGRSSYLSGLAAVLCAEGRYAEALAAGVEAAERSRTSLGAATQAVKQGLVKAVEAALALGDPGKAEELLAFVDELQPGIRPPYLDAQARRFRARMQGDPSGYEVAAAGFRGLGIAFWLAVTLLEHAELLAGPGQAGEAEPLLAEAEAIFDQLQARPWLESTAVLAGPQVPA